MQKGIIGKKLGMTQLFDESGKVVPVTVIEAGPCTVVQKKTVESDGYQAVQLGFGDIAARKVNKPAKGHFDKADVAPKKTLREFRLADISGLNVGDILKADVFAAGDHIDVVGVSKGKGYAGTIKCWNGHRLRESHGRTAIACARATVLAPFPAMPVPWAPAPPPAVCSRARSCPVTWALSASPSRTSRSSRWTPRII